MLKLLTLSTPKVNQDEKKERLSERFVRELGFRNYSPRTVRTYLAMLVQISRHYSKSPDILTIDQIKEYLYYCKEESYKLLYFNLKSIMQNFPYSEFNILIRLYNSETSLECFSDIGLKSIGKCSNVQALQHFTEHQNRTLILESIEQP
jgi:hypothetical protein